MYEYQEKFAHDWRACRSVSFILPAGAGKTRIALLWSKFQPAGRRMVVCPPSAIPVWHGEIRRWLGSDPIISVVAGGRSAKLAILHDLKVDWVIISYQSFRSLANHMAYQPTPVIA